MGGSRGVEPGVYRVGEFSIVVDQDAGFALSIRHRSEPGRVLWSSLPGESFVSAARGDETVEQSRAHFSIEDKVEDPRPDQTIDSVERERGSLVLKGRLLGGDTGGVKYELSFAPATEERLRFEVGVADSSYDRVYLTYASSPEERFFGFGTQYTYFDMKGRKVPIFIQEQGIGRGEQPITWGADWQAGAGGSPYTSYASVPHYVTSEMRSLFLENYEYSSFDLREKDRVQVEVFSSRMRGQILSGDTPAELIEQYTEYSGRMRPLPDWILSGAVIGMQGGTDRVRGVYKDLEALDTPVSAFWLQDWVGQRETSFGTQLWWNWELDENRYPRWQRLVADLRREDVRVMTYVSPFLADPSKKSSYERNLFAEAEDRGYLVEDRSGEPYMVGISELSAAMVDLTNPEARSWVKSVIKDNLIGGGASGWMADFGEGLPYDAVLSSGADPKSYHNRYAEEWAEVNREAIREAGRENDLVFFNRSGYTRSPGESTLFWLGDQLVSWDEHDGIKSAVTGLLSSGLSGYSLQHSDIGGYTAIIARRNFLCAGPSSVPSPPCFAHTRATAPQSTTNSTPTDRLSNTLAVSPRSTSPGSLTAGIWCGKPPRPGFPSFAIPSYTTLTILKSTASNTSSWSAPTLWPRRCSTPAKRWSRFTCPPDAGCTSGLEKVTARPRTASG